MWKQDTIVAQVEFRPIYEMCAGEEWMTWDSRFLLWWDQVMGLEVE